VLHHRFVPNARGRHRSNEFDVSYAINSLGLRDREMPRQAPPGTRRLLMLGDSFTEGNGVEREQTFSALIQALLDRDGLGARWQVVNAGIGSYSPLLEYLYLRNGGLDFQPNVVVLNFDLSDVYDDIQYTRLAVMGPDGDPVAVRAPASTFSESKRWRAEVSEPEEAPASGAAGTVVELKDFVKGHLRLYGFVRRRISAYLEVARQTDASGDIRVDKFAMLRDNYRPVDDRDWTLSFRYITMIRDLLAARGIGFWVTVYPYGLQVSPREWATGRRGRGFERGRVYTTRPQERLAQFCRSSGIPVVDLCPDFKELSRTVYPIYYDLDGHWYPAGHQLVANVLYRTLAPYLREREADTPLPRPNPGALRPARSAAAGASPGRRSGPWPRSRADASTSGCRRRRTRDPVPHLA
jgi:hypothetical protein